MVSPRLRGNILFPLMYLHIVNVDWWKPATVKYHSIQLPYFICCYPSISSVLLYCSVHTTTYKRTHTLCAICSTIPVLLATNTVVQWSENHASGALCSACCSFYCCNFPWRSATRRLWLCSVSDDAWRNWLSKKINGIATAVTFVFAFESKIAPLFLLFSWSFPVYWSIQTTACCFLWKYSV